MKHIAFNTSQKDILWLLAWAGILLVCSLTHTSLMAHDEGNYAAESRFMLDSGSWLARQWWGTPTYSHGILLNWLMMVGYALFGVSDRVARLPSIFACMASVVLTYDIAKILCASQPWPYAKSARQIGLLSGLLLMLISLWAQYGHLATQDMLLVSVELLGIWCLLKAEIHPQARLAFGFFAGLGLGLGFLIKTFMIALPAIALLPYLVMQNRRHRHLTNWGLYVGLLTGAGAVALWLGLSVAEYGDFVWASMFGKLTELSAQPFHADAGPLYYLWNIPVNAMPWSLFSLIGAGLMFCAPGFVTGLRSHSKQRSYPHRWLLLYPFILAGMLTTFSTKTPYYTLQLHPFMAMFSAIALYQIATQPRRWPRRLISYSFAAVGIVAAGLGLIVIMFHNALSEGIALGSQASAYGLLAMILGGGWAFLPVCMAQPKRWLAVLLLPAWLTFSTAGLIGLMGNYTPHLKEVIGWLPQISPPIEGQPIDFIVGDNLQSEAHKTFTLLSFYTPKLGQLDPPIAEIPAGAYAWRSPDFDPALFEDRPYETIVGVDNGWELIRLGK
ncbi:MAG: glycosyltransferase family 39 protein [Phormidesmis sp.]